MNWKENLLGSDVEIKELLRNTQTIAVVGIKMETHQPAYYVPKYMQDAGFKIVPVPVYYPEATEILGEKVYRKLTDIPVGIDLVNIFRRSDEAGSVVDEAVKIGAKAVWMQEGVIDEAAAKRAEAAGLLVVMDRCWLKDFMRYGG